MALTYQSLSEKFPDISKEWHPSKNGELTPSDFSCGSHRRVWWWCKQGHEWQAAVHNRARGTGCPYCCGQRVTGERSLAALYPQIAVEWHQTRNAKLDPSQVTTKSNRKVWWKCAQGHEWSAAVATRTKGHGCPFCSGKYLTPERSLAQMFPDVANEWHEASNSPLTPEMISASSNKRVWWKCRVGHEWQARVSNRTRGARCPYCAGSKVTSDNNLAAHYPEIAKEWHSDLNGATGPQVIRRAGS